MLPLLLAANAAEIPEKFHGEYYPKEVVDALFSDEPTGYLYGSHGVSGPEIWVDQVQDGTGFRVAEVLTGDRFMVTERYLEPAVFTDVSFSQAEGAPVVMTFRATEFVRLTEALPAMNLPEQAHPSAIATQALLSLGWIAGDKPWVFLPGGPAGHRILGTSDALEGGFGGSWDLFSYRGKEFTFSAGGGSLVLEEAEPEENGPDYLMVDDGAEIVLKRMDEAPFVILADRLKLRSGPRSKSPVLALVEGGTAVQVWAADREWLLIRSGKDLGWGHSAYVGRRTSPATGRPTTGTYTLAGAQSGKHPFQIRNAEGDSRCEAGGVGTPAIPTSTTATARVTNLDGAEPLDLICLISATDGRDRVVVACPITRKGDTATASPCGVIPEMPASVGSKEVEGGRALVLGESELHPSVAGWLDGVLPKPPPAKTVEATPKAAPPAPAAGGCGCAALPVLPLGLAGLMLPLVRRRRVR